MLEWALNYALLGWAVFPVHSVVDGRCTCGNTSCNSPGKHPSQRGWREVATNDANRVQMLFRPSQLLNIGIATGNPSGIYVVDVDVKPGRDGCNVLAELETTHSVLDKSMSVRTGSGGWHFYLPTHGRTVSNSASKVGAGIDIRGTGGYVVAPPSRHISGNTYEWVKFNE